MLPSPVMRFTIPCLDPVTRLIYEFTWRTYIRREPFEVQYRHTYVGEVLYTGDYCVTPCLEIITTVSGSQPCSAFFLWACYTSSLPHGR